MEKLIQASTPLHLAPPVRLVLHAALLTLLRCTPFPSAKVAAVALSEKISGTPSTPKPAASATGSARDRGMQKSNKTFSEELKDAQSEGRGVSIEHQVQRIIAEATRPENLCQAFSGWCAFW